MTTALYAHTTRASGTTLTAAIYNADHQNHITNGIAAMLGGYSANAAEMQTNTDPGEVGTESLAGSIADEIARLRFAIKETKQAISPAVNQWYESPQAGGVALPVRYIHGFDVYAQAPAGGGNISVNVGNCRDAGETRNLAVTTLLDRSVTALWDAGTATGGGWSGPTLTATPTPVHVFVFVRGTGDIDIGFDTDPSAANLQTRATMTVYRRVGTIMSGTNGRIIKSRIRDGYLTYLDPQWSSMASAFPVTNAQVTWSQYAIRRAPTGLAGMYRLRVAFKGGGGPYVNVGDYDTATGGAPNANTPVLVDLFNAAGGYVDAYCDNDAKVALWANNSALGFRLTCAGYYDRRLVS